MNLRPQAFEYKHLQEETMFFTEYDVLNTQIVTETVSAKLLADGGKKSPLAGQKFTARLNGEFAPSELSYEFVDGENLKVNENGTVYEAPYAVNTLGSILLITHQIPGTARAWHLVLDTRTDALTAFETWFGCTTPVGMDLTGQRPPLGTREIFREIQRQYYFGWADRGTNEQPEKLHTTTNRIEGRGLHWAYSDGYEELSFFPSIVCATFVDLGPSAGSITVTNPADYIRIDDEYYVFTNWDVEFSGRMRLEIMNFLDMEAVGMEFGLNEKNEAVYRMNSAKLTLTGDAAHLESINDVGDAGAPMPRVMSRKGGRYNYRPRDIDIPMTHEEALQHAAEHQRIFETPSGNFMASYNTLPPTDKLAGKKFRIQPDMEKYAQAPWSGEDKSFHYDYEFLTGTSLRFRIADGEWKEAIYYCMESDRNLFYFCHPETDSEDFAIIAQVVDMDNGLTTTVRTGIGNWRSEWEAGSRVYFGTLEYGDIRPPFARRHYFTDELVGQVLAWKYSDTMASIHVYSSPESYSWTIFQRDNSGGATWSSPSFYIKIRPEVYLFQWVEEKCNGSLGLLMFNRKIQHDSGYFYGVTHEGLRLEITGAYMRELGKYDILKYFGKKDR